MSVEARPISSVVTAKPAGSARRGLDVLPRREGAFWVLLALAMPRIFGAGFTIVLRRFFGPGASGLFDTASVPYSFLDNFRNFGTGPALVYHREVNRPVADTAWTLNMLAAILVTGAAQLLAHPIAVYYGHPQIEGIFRVLSIAYVFASAGSVHYFLLLRNLDFRGRSVPAVGQVAAGGVVALLFAVWGFGVGTLVAREVTSVIAGTVLLWLVYPFRPRIRLVPGVARTLFRYGAWVGLGFSILYVSQNIDVFIGGRIIRSPSDVGFYTTSWKLAFIAAGVFTTVATSMVFPNLSRLRDDPDALRATLIKATRQLGLVTFPAATLLAAVAPVVIVPVLGEQWAAYRSSFLVLSMLAIYAGNRTMLFIFFEGYKAIGKPWIVTVYNLAKLAVMVPAVIVGAEHGIVGLALIYIPIQILEIPLALVLARRVLCLPAAAVAGAVHLPIVASTAMAVAVIALEEAAKRLAGWGDVSTLLLCLVAGPALYVGIVLGTNRQMLREARSVFLGGL